MIYLIWIQMKNCFMVINVRKVEATVFFNGVLVYCFTPKLMKKRETSEIINKILPKRWSVFCRDFLIKIWIPFGDMTEEIKKTQPELIESFFKNNSSTLFYNDMIATTLTKVFTLIDTNDADVNVIIKTKTQLN